MVSEQQRSPPTLSDALGTVAIEKQAQRLCPAAKVQDRALRTVRCNMNHGKTVDSARLPKMGQALAAWRVEVVPRHLKSLALLTLKRSSRVQTGPVGLRQRSALLRGELVFSIGVPPVPSLSVFSCSGDTTDISVSLLTFLDHNVVQWTAARYVFDKCKDSWGRGSSDPGERTMEKESEREALEILDVTPNSSISPSCLDVAPPMAQ